MRRSPPPPPATACGGLACLGMGQPARGMMHESRILHRLMTWPRMSLQINRQRQIVEQICSDLKDAYSRTEENNRHVSREWSDTDPCNNHHVSIKRQSLALTINFNNNSEIICNYVSSFFDYPTTFTITHATKITCQSNVIQLIIVNIIMPYNIE